MAERERDMKTYVLYNPKAGSGAGKDAAMKLRAVCTEELEFRDITAIESYADFFDRIHNGRVIPAEFLADSRIRFVKHLPREIHGDVTWICDIV